MVSAGTGCGNKSSGLDVEHTLLVAMCRYFAVVARLRCPKQQLNGADVGALFKEVDGEGVSQQVRRDGFGNVASMVSLSTCVLNRMSGDVLARNIAGEEPVLRSLHTPPLSQDLQQFRGEHHVAILHSFALLDPQDHALAVDGGGCKSDGFGDAQSSSVTCSQDGTMLSALNRVKKSNDFLGG